MFRTIGQWLLIGLLLGALLIGGYFYYNFQTRQSEIAASVLLEQVKEVTKLVTLEGQFSELFRFEEKWGYDFAPLKKSAIIRVQATALIGYDFEGLSIQSDEITKTIRVGPIPRAKVISLEKDLDYYDFKQGIFNSFTKTDMNLIQHRADEIIRREIQESDLILRAEQQLNNHLEALRFSVQSIGWQLQIVQNVKETKPLEPIADPLTPN